MAALRKKNNPFLSNMIDKHQKMGEKCRVHEKEAKSGPYNAHPDATEEDNYEEIVYEPPFLGRLKGGD